MRALRARASSRRSAASSTIRRMLRRPGGDRVGRPAERGESAPRVAGPQRHHAIAPRRRAPAATRRQGERAGAAARRRRERQHTDDHALAAFDARPAEQDGLEGVGVQAIAARAAGQRDGAAIERQQVVAGSAVEAHPRGGGPPHRSVELVVARTTARTVARRGRQEPVAAGPAVEHIGVGPAEDRVGTAAAVEAVTTRAPVERVGAGVTAEHVRAGAAGDRLDAEQVIALAARSAAAEGEVHDDRRRALAIDGAVAPAAAVDAVVAGPAVEPVGGGAAAQGVAPGATEQVVAALHEQSVGGDRVLACLPGQAAGAGQHVVARAAAHDARELRVDRHDVGAVAGGHLRAAHRGGDRGAAHRVRVDDDAAVACGHRRTRVADAPFAGTEPVDRHDVAFPGRGEVLHMAGREVPEDVVLDPRLRHAGRSEARGGECQHDGERREESQHRLTISAHPPSSAVSRRFPAG